MTDLSTSFEMKNLKLKNRIVMAPMCQYSVDLKDGVPNEWHFVHYVSRAVGGSGLIVVEMTAVEPNGRITDGDLGLWSDQQILAYQRMVSEVQKHGAKIGIQIGHAGRKAEDTDEPVGPSSVQGKALPEETKYGELKRPRSLTVEEIQHVIVQFKEAAERAVKAGFDTIELHGAHGYLLHQFMSPSMNVRTDEYGQDRSKFGVEVIRAVKSVMPEDMPLIMRLSAIEYIDGGYDIDYALNIAEQFKMAGVDIFHISSGGEGVPGQLKPLNTPGYQVPFAKTFKEQLRLPVIAVGRLEDASLAQATIEREEADLVAIARGMLNDPYWALHAIKSTTSTVIPPFQYARGIR